VLVLGQSLRGRVEPFADALPKLREVIDVTGSDYAAAIDAGGDIAAFLERATPTPADPAMILSTSGTTGTPKGVTQFGSFCVGSYVAYKKWSRTGPVKAYICTSWGHGTIQFMSTLAFWTGGSVVLAERFSASRFFHEVHKYGCTYIHLIGTMQRMLFNQPAGEHDEDHGVLLCMSAGMPPDVWEGFEDRFHVKVVEIYSSTDAGGSWVTNPGRYPVGSVGRPWAETEARVVDDDGAEVPDGSIGELQLRPRSNPPIIHYYNDPSASLDKIREGWVWMGDYFKRDPEGNLWFIDRKRDLIRRRGINLAPASIEEAIRAHEGVFDVCAIAVPSELGEDDIKVVVVPMESTLSPRELGEFAEGVLPKHMRPRYIEMAAQLPMTSGTQRVVRYQLREAWRNPRTWDVGAGAFVVGEE
jgi:crotonobetaine/carnitine-CoA ligase